MGGEDIRWKQRFSNYKAALQKLHQALIEENLNDLEKEGLIQRFEYTYELAWKTLQDLLQHYGYTDVKGPTPVLRQALKDGYIVNERTWREMKQARELTSHTYDNQQADQIADRIRDFYFDQLMNLKRRLDEEFEKA
jgi:nucleotidyltransferase substrate binding protein (TIGR01987 family)